MTDLARAIIDQLDPEDVAALAELLRPHLEATDRWLSVRDAASYAGASVNAVRHAIGSGALEHEQRCAGGKVWVRRSAIDAWRST